jgi:uncharacterized protein (TIGR00369 family)
MTSDSTEQRVRASFDRQGFMTAIGAKVKRVGDGDCVIELPFSEHVTQQHGYFHGGAVASIADSAAGLAAFTTMDEDQQPLTVEFKISLVAPAIGETVEARGRVIKSGRRLKFVQADVFAIESGTETLVAIALATITASRSAQEKR